MQKAAYDMRSSDWSSDVCSSDRMELGNLSNVKWIGGGLGEYRIDWGPGYRLYVTQDGDQLVILFVGGTKKRQQADIKQAGALLDEYKGRKAKAKKARS